MHSRIKTVNTYRLFSCALCGVFRVYFVSLNIRRIILKTTHRINYAKPNAISISILVADFESVHKSSSLTINFRTNFPSASRGRLNTSSATIASSSDGNSLLNAIFRRIYLIIWPATHSKLKRLQSLRRWFVAEGLKNGRVESRAGRVERTRENNQNARAISVIYHGQRFRSIAI